MSDLDCKYELSCDVGEIHAVKKASFFQLCQAIMRRAFALLLFFISFPFLVFFVLLIRLKMGSPVFYAGERFGLGKKKFVIYKLRTLPREFHRIYSGELVSHKTVELSPLQYFLRDTRMDELPQLINIFKGDMNFVGPRPLRPKLYEKYCRHIPGYDKRFRVKPGLIGYSQLFTPHGTPKRIRSFIDNNTLEVSGKFGIKVYLFSLTLWVVIKRCSGFCLKFAIEQIFEMRFFRRYSEKYALDRGHQKWGEVYILQGEAVPQRVVSEGQVLAQGSLYDMNEEFLRVDVNSEFPREILFSTRGFPMGCSCHGGKKSALCRGKVVGGYLLQNGKYTYIIRYEPVSQLNQYLIDQYFLNKSMVNHGP